MMELMLNGKGWLNKIAGMYKTDDRRHARLPAEFHGTLAGPFGKLKVTGVDANRDGAGVQSPETLPLGTLVFFRITELGLMGFAHVRHCSRRADGYFLGLQFREGLARERGEIGNWSVERQAQSGYRLWDEAEA
jgi:hypothetical protein